MKKKKGGRVGSTSQADIDKYSAQIFNQARAGTPFKPGVPVTLANLMVAQARHETGNFSSNAFKKHNNAFGYAYYQGSNYQTGDEGLIADNGQPVADYATVNDSVKELVDWIYRRVKEKKFPALDTIKTPEQYATLLKGSGYYGDTIANYWAGLKSFFNDISGKAGGSLGVALVAVAVVGYIYRKQLFPGL